MSSTPFISSLLGNHLFQQPSNIKQNHASAYRFKTQPIMEDSRQKQDDVDTTHLSRTQKELRSHQIIRELLHKSKMNVIERAPHHIRTYSNAKDTKTVSQEMKQNTDMQQSKKNKLMSIYQQLRKQTPMWLRVKKAHNSQIPRSLATFEKHQKIHSKSISIAALSSYHFKSVKSRQRLAYSTQGTQQQADDNRRRSQQARCGILRANKIRNRASTIEVDLQNNLNTAISYSYPQYNTDQYLQLLRKEGQKDKLIYGSQLNHLESVAQVMAYQGVNQQLAEFSVMQVRLPTKAKKMCKQMSRKIQKIEDVYLQRRRLPKSQKKIMSTHSYDA